MTDEIRTEVEKQLSAVQAPSLVSDDLIDMVKLYANQTFISAWRHGDLTSSGTYWYSLAFKVNDARILIAGMPGDGLIEVFIFAKYADIDEFNSLVHNYLILPDTLKAEIDYRPTGLRPASDGTLHPAEWDHQGYIIRIDEPGRTGWVRSSSRGYTRYDTEAAVPEDKEIMAIELSLRIEPAFQPDN